MIIIDPLKNRLLRQMRLGRPSPLTQALSGFGSNEDLDYLKESISSVLVNDLFDDARKYVFIDLTPPFVQITRQIGIIQTLSVFNNPRPVILLQNGELLDWLRVEYNKKNIPLQVVCFNDGGFYEKVIGASIEDVQFQEQIVKDFTIQEQDGTRGISLGEFRRKVAQKNLYNYLLKCRCIEFPKYSMELKEKNNQNTLIRDYLPLKNGMLVSCYLNLKTFGLDFESLLDVVYEVFLNLENYFITNSSRDFQYFITTNNTALFIASLLQTIYENKQIIPIDKLGPIPSLRLHSQSLHDSLKGKDVIIFEEVVGTGSEVDRAIMFLNHMEANIKKIVALYDLQVGKPLLTNDTLTYEALCTPKEELKYEYRSR